MWYNFKTCQLWEAMDMWKNFITAIKKGNLSYVRRVIENEIIDLTYNSYEAILLAANLAFQNKSELHKRILLLLAQRKWQSLTDIPDGLRSHLALMSILTKELPENFLEENMQPTLEISAFHENILQEYLDLFIFDHEKFISLNNSEKTVVLDFTRILMQTAIDTQKKTELNHEVIRMLDEYGLWEDGIEKIINVLLHPCPQNRTTGSEYVHRGKEGVEYNNNAYFVYSMPFGFNGGIAVEQQGIFSFTSFSSDEGKHAQITRCHPGKISDDEICSDLKFSNLQPEKNNPFSKMLINAFLLKKVIEQGICFFNKTDSKLRENLLTFTEKESTRSFSFSEYRNDINLLLMYGVETTQITKLSSLGYKQIIFKIVLQNTLSVVRLILSGFSFQHIITIAEKQSGCLRFLFNDTSKILFLLGSKNNKLLPEIFTADELSSIIYQGSFSIQSILRNLRATKDLALNENIGTKAILDFVGFSKFAESLNVLIKYSLEVINLVDKGFPFSFIHELGKINHSALEAFLRKRPSAKMFYKSEIQQELLSIAQGKAFLNKFKLFVSNVENSHHYSYYTKTEITKDFIDFLHTPPSAPFVLISKNKL